MVQKILYIALLTTLLAACTLPKVAGIDRPTVDVATLKTQAVATVVAAAHATATTGSSPVVSTPTPTSDKMVLRFDADTNCRGGPDVRFERVAIIKAGQIVDAQGAPTQGNYWVVKNPNGSGLCWVVADFVTPSGNMGQLPKMTAPPTYTAQPAPRGPSLISWDYSCEFASNDNQSGSNVTVTLKWQDVSNNEQGYNVYRNDAQVVSLAANSVEYSETVYLGYGDTESYFIEAYNTDGTARSKVISISCQ